MENILTPVEASIFARVGFEVRSEVVVKERQVLDISKLATSNKVEEDFFSTVSTSGYTIYNVYDKKGTPIILDIESKEELIEKVKELTSSLLG